MGRDPHDRGMTPRLPESLRIKIQDRNRRWFPTYRAVHESYIDLINQSIGPQCRALHLGAGADSLRVTSKLAPCRVIATDLSLEGLASHPATCKAVADAARLPFQSESFDLIFCEHVFEHLERPAATMAECFRTLTPGGALIFLAPNRWNYISLVAHLIPIWLREAHKRKLVPEGDAQGDAYPTFYRLNTRGAIESAGLQAGLVLERFESVVGWPTYLETSDILHRLGVALHWALERCPRCFHISLYGLLRKPITNLG